MKRGIQQISGNPSPTIGKSYLYKVTSVYSASKNLADKDIKWVLYKKQPGGQWRKVNGPAKTGMQVTYSFGQIAFGHEFLLEAYVYEPEGEAPPGIIIKPQQGPPKISKAEILDASGKALSTKPHFFDTVTLKVTTENMIGKSVTLSLWEDDTFSNDLLWGKQTFKIENKNGIVSHRMQLSAAMRNKGGAFLEEGWEQEVYLLAEAAKAKAGTSATTNIVIEPRQANTAAKGGTYKPQKPQTGNAPAGVGGAKNQKGNSICICKEQYKDLVWGGKVNCEFRKKVVELCAELWGEGRKMEMANGLMAVMKVETDGSFKAHQIMGKPLEDVNSITKDDFWLIKKDKQGKVISKTSRAVGLIQFTQAALQQIGEFASGSGFDKLHEVKLQFAKMGEVSQLDYVKKYFEGSKNKIKSPEDIYLHVFAPKGVGKADDYELYIGGTEEYRQNKSIDEKSTGSHKNDKIIQRSEILERYNDSLSAGKNNKASTFTCSTTPKAKENTNSKCPNDCSQCLDYADVVDNPKLNNQSDNVNKNRYHRKMRYNSAHPKGYYHTGVDILAALNTELKSLLCGEVIEAYDTEGDLGKIVTIKSKDKDGIYIWIRYCHLNSISVTKGQTIKHGIVMGKSGNTGNAKGIKKQFYHVHIEASTDGVFYGGNTRVNPEQFMKTKFDETDEGNSIK